MNAALTFVYVYIYHNFYVFDYRLLLFMAIGASLCPLYCVRLMPCCWQDFLWENKEVESLEKNKDTRRSLHCILFLPPLTSFFFLLKTLCTPSLLSPSILLFRRHEGRPLWLQSFRRAVWRCIESLWHAIISDLGPALCLGLGINLPSPQLFPSITPSVTPLSCPFSSPPPPLLPTNERQ